MIPAILEIVAGVALLYFGAEFLVRGGVRIATGLGVTPLVIGLTLVAFATSAPELVVSVTGALRGSGDLAVGNVVGSNICNIALILGATALLCPLPVRSQLLRFDMPLLLTVSVVFAVIGWGCGGIGRIPGGIFLLGLITYTVWSVRSARREAAADIRLEQEQELELEELCGGDCRASGVSAVLAAFGLALLGLAMLVGGGYWFVVGASEIGRVCGLSEAVIGLTIVSVGTSLPEFATSLVAALRKESDIAIGNVIGSNLFNILCIMGVAPLVTPLHSSGILPADWGMMIFLAALLYLFMGTGKRISRGEGGVLLAIFIGYTGYLIWRS